MKRNFKFPAVLFVLAAAIAMLSQCSSATTESKAAANPTVNAAKASAAQPVALKVGEKAPDFTLPDQQGKDISLSQFLGKKNVVLAFYVLAFTGG